MSGSAPNSEERLQRTIQDLFPDEEDDDMYEPATEQSGMEDETETDSFTGWF